MNFHLKTLAYPTRALAAEYPVGDPFGGPAYGKREMPVVAVVAAIASFVGGAAIATAAGATIGAMIVGGAMMVGAALTVVGTVTGNQNLVKWGGILALAGGLGAGVLGAMGGLADGAATATEATAGASAGDADQALANQAVANGGAGAPPPVQEPSGLLSTGAPPDAAATPSLAGAQPPVPDVTPTTPAAAPAPGPDAFNAPATPAPAPNSFTPAAPNAFQTPAPVTDLSKPATGGSWWSNATAYAGSHPELTRAALTGASGLLGSVVPKPLNALDRANMNFINSRTAIENMRAGITPGWWYGKPAGG